MADEARSVRNFGVYRYQADGTVTPYEVRQMPDGQAAVFDSPAAATSGVYVDYTTIGVYQIVKSTSVALLKGGRAYWDHSAGQLTYLKASDRDFYVGRVVEDAAANNPTCLVELNVDPRYDIDLLRDGYTSILVGTPAAGGFGYPRMMGGALEFELTATSEAQKVDALSVDGFAKGANPILEFVVRVISDGASGSQDISIGAANATDAADADLIADSVFVHLNGNDVNIYLESDDGTTEVAATDTTIDYSEGGTLAKRFEVWMDWRDPADIQMYVNGAQVLASSVFNVDAYSGTWFLLIHVEKASGTDVYKLAIDRATARFSEQ